MAKGKPISYSEAELSFISANPKTGETLTIPAVKKPRFRPGKPLKEAVK